MIGTWKKRLKTWDPAFRSRRGPFATTLEDDVLFRSTYYTRSRSNNFLSPFYEALGYMTQRDVMHWSPVIGRTYNRL